MGRRPGNKNLRTLQREEESYQRMLAFLAELDSPEAKARHRAGEELRRRTEDEPKGETK